MSRPRAGRGMGQDRGPLVSGLLMHMCLSGVEQESLCMVKHRGAARPSQQSLFCFLAWTSGKHRLIAISNHFLQDSVFLFFFWVVILYSSGATLTLIAMGSIPLADEKTPSLCS